MSSSTDISLLPTTGTMTSDVGALTQRADMRALLPNTLQEEDLKTDQA